MNTAYSFLWPILLLVIVIAEVVAMGALTVFGKDRKILAAIAGVVGYLSIGILFASVMVITDGTKLAFLNASWNASTVVLTSILAVTYFGESLFWYQWIGVAMAVVAVVLLSVGEMATK